MNSAISICWRWIRGGSRLVVAAGAIILLSVLSLQIGSLGAALFTPASPSFSAEPFEALAKTPSQSRLAAATGAIAPSYAVPKYAPISSVESMQYRMNRVLIREEVWRTRSAPWEIVDYYARHFAAGLWEDVTDDQFGLTRNEGDPSHGIHSESFDEWAERYHKVRSHNLAVRRGGRSVRVNVTPGSRGLSTIRVVWAETPNLKGYFATLAHGLKDSAMSGGETRWVLGEDCHGCPEPDMSILHFPGEKEGVRRRIAGQQAEQGWARRMDFSEYPDAGDLSVWGRDDQVRMISLSEQPHKTGTDVLILTVRD